MLSFIYLLQDGSEIPSMSLIGETKLSILRELASGPSHGYAIAEELGMSHGGIYTHLKELQEESIIEVKEEQEGGRGKKMYDLTENGHLLLRALGEN